MVIIAYCLLLYLLVSSILCLCYHSLVRIGIIARQLLIAAMRVCCCLVFRFAAISCLVVIVVIVAIVLVA